MAFLTPPVLSQESPALMAGGIWSTPNSPFPLQNPTDEQLRGQIHQNRETPGGRQGLGTRWGGGRCRATLRHLWPLPVPEFMEVWWLVPRMGRNPTLGTGHILVGGCPGTAPPPGVRATTDTGGGLSSTHFIKDAPRACPCPCPLAAEPPTHLWSHRCLLTTLPPQPGFPPQPQLVWPGPKGRMGLPLRGPVAARADTAPLVWGQDAR